MVPTVRKTISITKPRDPIFLPKQGHKLKQSTLEDVIRKENEVYAIPKTNHSKKKSNFSKVGLPSKD